MYLATIFGEFFYFYKIAIKTHKVVQVLLPGSGKSILQVQYTTRQLALNVKCETVSLIS